MIPIPATEGSKSNSLTFIWVSRIIGLFQGKRFRKYLS